MCVWAARPAQTRRTSAAAALRTELSAAGEADAELIGLRALTLDLRETQSNAIRTYESRGYTRWGTQPQYALIDGQWIAGDHSTKELR